MLLRRLVARLADLRRVRAVTAALMIALACTDRPQASPSRLNSIAVQDGGDLAFDSLFPPLLEIGLKEAENRPIGDATDAVLGPSGRLYLIDFPMREVKVFGRDGSFIRSLGRQGQGPGEYLAPTSITRSPWGDRLAVTDLSGERVLIADAGIDSFVETRQTVVPLSAMSALHGVADTLFVLGGADNPLMDQPSEAAVVAADGRSVRQFLAEPRRLHRKPVVQNVLRAVGAQTTRFLYLAINLSPVVYRYTYAATVSDSVVLPESWLRPAQLPDEAPPDIGALKRLMKQVPLLTGIRVASDSLIVLSAEAYSPAADEFQTRIALLSWKPLAHLWGATPCTCSLVGVVGDTLFVLQRVSLTSYKLEGRRISVPIR